MNRRINCLDKGYVELVDIMGSDRSIVETARLSTGSSSKEVESLLRYLVREGHNEPLEFCQVVLEIKCPIAVARHILRHRTSSVNEASARYRELDFGYYLPSNEFVTFSAGDKHSIIESDDVELCNHFIEKLNESSDASYKLYQDMLQKGISREHARLLLGTSFYTLFRIRFDLNNLFNHFLKKRTDRTSQVETREYANAIEEIVKDKFPIAHQAYLDYIKNSIKLSALELDILRDNQELRIRDLLLLEGDLGLSKSELVRFREKIELITTKKGSL